jgi:hypothetical protein
MPPASRRSRWCLSPLVTKMLSFSVPPGYRRRERPASKKLGPYIAWIDAILEGDSQVHKKQRHTAYRIFERLRDEQGFTGGYTIVREHVAAARLRAREMFLSIARDIVRRQGGEIKLLDHAPQGLTVRLSVGEQPHVRTSNVSVVAENYG